MRQWFLITLAFIASPALSGQTPICSMEMIPLDKRAEPTVEYEVMFFEQPTLRKMCRHEWAASRDYIWGCAADEGGFWGIYVERRLDDANRACVVLHEKAHLPPNRWQHEGSFTATPGPIYRNVGHMAKYHNWVATAPEVKPVTYD